MIRKYKRFITEVFRPTETDPPEQISQMNQFNDMEKFITEFNQKKSIVEDIYKKYTDDADLVKQLKSKQLISSNNIKEMKFINPLIGMWAKSCEKRRQLTELQSKTKDTQQQIGIEQDSSKGNTLLKDTLGQSIRSKQETLSSDQEKIRELDLEIRDLEKRAKDQLLKMKKDLELSRKQIRTYTSQKT